MDYNFNETVFRSSFNVNDLKGEDVSRLTHSPDKKFRLFPYRANGKVHIVTELKEIISEFFKLSLAIETEEIQFEKLFNNIKKNISIDKDDEPFLKKTINRIFFRDGKFIANNIGLYAYQSHTENKSAENLAFFLFCVLGIDEEDCEMIKMAKEKYSYNVLEKIVIQSISTIQNQTGLKDKKYYSIIEGIQSKFKSDFKYMLNNGMTEPEDIENLLDLYYFYYITQTCITLDNFCSGKRANPVELYYALDWERVSGNRKCCTYGWEALQQNVNHLFCHAITLELINQHEDENLMYDYIKLKEFIGEDKEKDVSVANEIRNVESAYINCIGDYKKFSEIPIQEGINETDKAIRHLFKCVEEQFLNTERKRANKFYIEKFELYAKERWLKNRRKSGIVLNLTERDIIFLTKISLKNLDKIRLNDLFKAYENRGIFLDNISKKILQEFFTKLNLIDKKSDSGDAQYVKRIL